MNYKTQIIDRLRSEIRREAQYKPAPLPSGDKIILENEKLINELKDTFRRISESNLSDGVQKQGKGLLI